MDKKKAKVRLTDNQENFGITCVMNNDNATASYKEHYSTDNMTDNTIWVEAHRVRHNPKVAQRIEELRKQRFSKKILSIDERKILLSEWAVEGDYKSLDILNKMEGVYVEKQEVVLAGHITMLPAKDKDN